ncbi:spore germination protein, partial [Cohnella boryungensis]
MQASKNTGLELSLKANLEMIKSTMGGSEDLMIKEMTGGQGWNGALIYIDGLTDSRVILHTTLSFQQSRKEADGDRLAMIKASVLAAGDVKMFGDKEQLFSQLISGKAIFLLEDCRECLSIGAEGWKDRNVGEPTSQNVVRGPMEAFTENIRTNTALIRRKIKDSRLWLEGRRIGSVTLTNVAIMYINGIAEPSLVEEVRRRLERISIDGILESGYIEEFIQESSYSPRIVSFESIFKSVSSPRGAGKELLKFPANRSL